MSGLRLDLTLIADADPVRYEGSVELPDGTVGIRVEVSTSERAADGLNAVATAPQAPASVREKLEGLAAAMARSAVRGARKAGMSPPRRIRRWREV